MPETSPPPLYSVGRIARWLVVALMLGSILYSVWIGVVNWSSILV